MKLRAWLAGGAAVLDVAALVALFLPLGGESCASSATTARGQPPPPVHSVCHAVPMITAFAAAIPFLALMVALGLVPLLTLRSSRRWPGWTAAAVQAVLMFLSLGAFAFWVPAWILTIASAAVPRDATR